MENWTYAYSSTCRHILRRNFGTCGTGDVYENFLNGNVQTSKNKTKQKICGGNQDAIVKRMNIWYTYTM